MTIQTSGQDSAALTDTIQDTTGIAGHPRGLTTLFFTEMWERFSYYGMRALLILYMTTPVVSGGMGMDIKRAAGIYAAYVGSVYLMSIPGGWIADNVLGTRMGVLIGGILIAMGHFSMALPTTVSFFAGLILIVLGTGLLKPNVSVLVGSLYSANDPRRDAGFSIFYMGINIGAALAPLICSYLGENINWHLGFGMAGIFMTLGLIQYVAHRDRIAHIGNPPALPRVTVRRNALFGSLFMTGIMVTVILLYFGPKIIQEYRVYLMIGGVAVGMLWLFTFYLKSEEKKPVAAIVVLFCFSVIFWATFEQAGSSFNLFARDFTDRSVPASIANLIRSAEFPAGWYQSINSIFLISLAPVFSWLWLKLGERQPSSPIKFAIGLFFVGLGAVILTIASSLLDGGIGRVGPYWLVGVYLCNTIGELCLSPVGLSTTTKLAPERLSGLMMGVWFLSISFGNFFAGEVAGNFSRDALIGLFAKVAAGPIIAAIILVALTPFIRRLMGKVS